MSAIPRITLNNGQQMPILGLGTYAHADGDDRAKVYQAVRDAILAGYRHIDTASIYEIEDEVGRAINDAIKAGDVTREEMFIVTKLWLTSFRKDRVIPALKESLSKLNLSYIDLYLIHWPLAIDPASPNDKRVWDDLEVSTETWPKLEEAVKLGLTKSIGISNFNSEQVDKLMKVATIKPVTNQVESHPFLVQRKLKNHCDKYEIVLTAYSPLGGSPIEADRDNIRKDVRLGLFENELIKELAAKYSKSAGQILLKFQVQRGIIVIPKSVTKSRIIENSKIFDFELTSAEIEQLEGLNQNYRYVHSLDFSTHKHFPFNIEF